MKKEVTNNKFADFQKRNPNVRITIDPTIKVDHVKVNPKKLEDAKRILSSLKGPLPWDTNNRY